MKLPDETVAELQKRLRRVEGQIRGIQAMLDVYADTGMVGRKLDAAQFKHPSIVAPIE